jgi:hypothetical protein
LPADPGDGGLATSPHRLTGWKGPDSRAVIRGIAEAIFSGQCSIVRIQPAVSEQIAGVVQSCGEIAVVDFLLDETILHRAVLLP